MKEKSKELSRKWEQAHLDANARRRARTDELWAKLRFNSELKAHVSPTTPLFDPKLCEKVTASAREALDKLSEHPDQASPPLLSHERPTTPKK